MKSKKLDEVYEQMKSDMDDKMIKIFIKYVQNEDFKKVRNRIEKII